MTVIRNRKIKISVEDKDKNNRPSKGDVVKIESGLGKKKFVTTTSLSNYLKSPDFKFLGDKKARMGLIATRSGRRFKADVKEFAARGKMPGVSVKIMGYKNGISLMDLFEALEKGKFVKIEIRKAGKKEIISEYLGEFLTSTKFEYLGDTGARLEYLGIARGFGKFVRRLGRNSKERSKEAFLQELFRGLINDASGSGSFDKSKLKDLVAEYRDYSKLKYARKNPFSDFSLIKFLIASFGDDTEQAFDLYNKLMERLDVSDRLLMSAENSKGKLIEVGGSYEPRYPMVAAELHHVDYIFQDAYNTLAYELYGSGIASSVPIDAL